MYTFSFEKLDVWKKSRQLAKSIYLITQNFPDEERYGLAGQLRRAIISVCSNIAEGSSRKSRRDQVHFYNMSFSSLVEVLNQLIISNDLNYIDEITLRKSRIEITTITLLLNGLCNSLSQNKDTIN